MEDTVATRLKKSFDKYFNAPFEAWQEFASRCELVTFKKNEVIKPAGMQEHYGYFILQGSGGVFISRENGKVCLDLVYQENFFGDHMSLISGSASPLITMALEYSEMLRISATNIDELKRTQMGQFIFLIAAEQSFVDKQQQQIDLLIKTAEQRYLELLDRQPDIILRTSQKHIASYLGITTQSLSRIRSRIR